MHEPAANCYWRGRRGSNCCLRIPTFPFAFRPSLNSPVAELRTRPSLNSPGPRRVAALLAAAEAGGCPACAAQGIPSIAAPALPADVVDAS